MSDTKALERMVHRTTLTTQRILHTHILALGERLRPRSPTSPAADVHPGALPDPPSMHLPLDRTTQPDYAWKEELQLAAKEETEKALKLQEECLQAQFREALQARERLESELRQGQQAELRVELRAHLEARCARLREQMEEEKRLAVQEACRRLREELMRESKQEREQEMRTIQEQMEVRVQECVTAAEHRVREECESEAQRERQNLQDSHAQEIAVLQDRLQQMQDRLAEVCRERMQYETEFKKVQASYRQFVDLTDTSLHSDYLLMLRRLGREPGLMENSTQTDISHFPTTP